MKQSPQRVPLDLARYDLGLAALFLFLSVECGLFAVIADSEFWSINVAKLFGQTSHEHMSIYYKPLFHALLKVPYFYHLNNVQHLYFAKAIFAALGAGIVLIVYFFVRKLYGPRWGLVAVAFLISSNLFFTQFFRVRSDVLACTLALIHLAALTRAAHRTHQRPIGPLALSALVSLFMILATPKAVYFLLVNSAFYILATAGRPWISRATQTAFAGFFAPSLFFVITAVYPVSGVDFRSAYLNALDYFVLGFLVSPDRDVQLNHWNFFKVFFRQDLIHTSAIALLISVALLRKSWNRFSSFERSFLSVLPLIVLAMLVHNQKFPFYLASWIPYFAVSSVILLRSIPTNQVSKILIAALAIWGLNVAAHWSDTTWWRSNHIQMKKAQELELFIERLTRETRQEIRYFDGQGILPRAAQVMEVFSPLDRRSIQGATENFRSRRPEVVLRLYRSKLAEPAFTTTLRQDYRHVGGGVFLRKDIDSKIRFSPEPNLANVFGFF